MLRPKKHFLNLAPQPRIANDDWANLIATFQFGRELKRPCRHHFKPSSTEIPPALVTPLDIAPCPVRRPVHESLKISINGITVLRNFQEQLVETPRHVGVHVTSPVHCGLDVYALCRHDDCYEVVLVISGSLFFVIG